ncbi:hypothetical protein LIP_1230 [Limnochorda pilosa]|uniref:DUF6431 domain-containing protein n=1 Tax=Limnochorda pilosa TaxID=1555112 RepID=A0A0K2SJ75_LIMPI|nr:hypothetical protein LIP_1230 [Limnochorda pilosa]
MESYLRLFEEGKNPIVRTCPVCQGELQKHGHYDRHATEEAGPWQALPIQRMICRVCRVTVSLLPSFLRPYQSLASALREFLLQGRLRGERAAPGRDGRPLREDDPAALQPLERPGAAGGGAAAGADPRDPAGLPLRLGERAAG